MTYTPEIRSHLAEKASQETQIIFAFLVRLNIEQQACKCLSPLQQRRIYRIIIAFLIPILL